MRRDFVFSPLFFPLFFPPCKRTRPMACIRQPCLIYLSTCRETVLYVYFRHETPGQVTASCFATFPNKSLVWASVVSKLLITEGRYCCMHIADVRLLDKSPYHTSLRLRCNHFNTSRCPCQAAKTMAYTVQPSVRFDARNCSTWMCPLDAALSIAAVVHPSGRL